MNGEQLYYYKGKARGRSKKTRVQHIDRVLRMIRDHLSIPYMCDCDIKILTQDGSDDEGNDWFERISFSKDATFYPLVIPCKPCSVLLLPDEYDPPILDGGMPAFLFYEDEEDEDLDTEDFFCQLYKISVYKGLRLVEEEVNNLFPKCLYYKINYKMCNFGVFYDKKRQSFSAVLMNEVPYSMWTRYSTLREALTQTFRVYPTFISNRSRPRYMDRITSTYRDYVLDDKVIEIITHKFSFFPIER